MHQVWVERQISKLARDLQLAEMYYSNPVYRQALLVASPLCYPALVQQNHQALFRLRA
jgi:hypothetical protein